MYLSCFTQDDYVQPHPSACKFHFSKQMNASLQRYIMVLLSLHQLIDIKMVSVMDIMNRAGMNMEEQVPM